MKFNKINKIKDYNKKIIKAKIINAQGSVPRAVGDFMLITENEIYGSIGGGQLEFMVIDKAQEIFIVYSPEVLSAYILLKTPPTGTT